MQHTRFSLLAGFAMFGVIALLPAIAAAQDPNWGSGGGQGWNANNPPPDNSNNPPPDNSGNQPPATANPPANSGAQPGANAMARQSPAADSDDWMGFLDFSGVFTYRLQYAYTERGVGNVLPGYGIDQFRMRYRLLLNFGIKVDAFEAGAQIGTTNIASATNDTFVTMGPSFTAQFVAIRQAWGRVSLLDEMLAITVGQFPYPSKTLFRSLMTFDEETNPTGAHVLLRAVEETDANDVVTMGIYGHLMWLYVVENAGGGPEDSHGFLFGGRAVVSLLSAGLNFWWFTHARSVYFAGQRGEILDLNAELDMGRMDGGVDLRVMFQFLHNVGSSRRKTGLLLGVIYGNAYEKGGFQAGLEYYYLDNFTWPAPFTDSTIARLTMPGTSGLRLHAAVEVANNLFLRFQLAISYLLRDQQPNADDTDVFSNWLLDVEFRF